MENDDYLADLLANDTDRFVKETDVLEDFVRFLYKHRSEHDFQFVSAEGKGFQAYGHYFWVGDRKLFHRDEEQILYKLKLGKNERKITEKYKKNNYSYRNADSYQLCAHVIWDSKCDKTLKLKICGNENFDEFERLTRKFPEEYNRRIELKFITPINNNAFLLLK